MNHWIEIFTPLMLVGLLLFSQPTYANNDGQIVLNPVINIDIGGLISAINSSGSSIVGAINPLSKTIGEGAFGLFRGYFEDSVRQFNSPLAQTAKQLLVSSPDVEVMKNAWAMVVEIITGLYILVFFAVGLLFTMSFLGAEKKVLAKEWFKGLVVMIVLVAFSFEIYKLALSLTDAISSAFIGLIPDEFFNMQNILSAGVIGALVYSMGAMFALFTFFIRHVFVMLGAVLFPLGIFLYYNIPFRNWGLAVFNLIGSMLVLQVLDIIILGSAAQVGRTFFGETNSVYFGTMAFVLIGFVNLGVIFFAFLKAGLSIGWSFTKMTLSIGSIAANSLNSAKK